MTREEVSLKALEIRSYLHTNWGSGLKGRGFIEHHSGSGMAHYPRDMLRPFEDYLVDKVLPPDQMFFSTGNSSGRLQIYNIAHSMLERLIGECDIDDILNAIDDVLQHRTSAIATVKGIVGISVDGPIEVERDVWLVGRNDVPATIQRERLFGIDRWGEAKFNIHGFSIEMPPTAALIFKKFAVQILGEGPNLADKSVFDEIKRMDGITRRVCAAACLSCSSSPFPSWTYSTALHPAIGYSNFGSYGGTGSFYPQPFRTGKVDPKKFARYFQLIASMKSGQKNVLLALDRLILSRARHSHIDKAIDLGIALEVTLLNQMKEGELSYRLRNRGAWLLGRDFEERDRISKLLNKLYSLRSQAAHNGEFSGALLKDGAFLRVLEEGDNICGDIIGRIVEAGCFPDWDSLSMGKEGN